MTTLDINDRQICDLELLLIGGFNPLVGFLNKNDYESVLSNMRLVDGDLWPIPITLMSQINLLNTIKNNKKITLQDKEGFSLAILKLEDIWEPNLKLESKLLFGTVDDSHPGVNYF